MKGMILTEEQIAAFSDAEAVRIPTVTVSADKNPEYASDPGNATQDRVFLLSIHEVNQYFDSDAARICVPTDYALANGAWESDEGTCWWWLRSPGFDQNGAAGVNCDVGVNEFGIYVCNVCAVRPALWIDLNS